MKSDYKTFKFTLRTMAPVHIGSGEKYTSREFIYENDSFYFPDMGKFYASMVAKGLDRKFEAFLMEHGKRAVNNRLVSFTYDNRIKDRNFGGYKIKESDYENDKSSLGTFLHSHFSDIAFIVLASTGFVNPLKQTFSVGN